MVNIRRVGICFNGPWRVVFRSKMDDSLDRIYMISFRTKAKALENDHMNIVKREKYDAIYINPDGEIYHQTGDCFELAGLWAAHGEEIVV